MATATENTHQYFPPISPSAAIAARRIGATYTSDAVRVPIFGKVSHEAAKFATPVNHATQRMLGDKTVAAIEASTDSELSRGQKQSIITAAMALTGFQSSRLGALRSPRCVQSANWVRFISALGLNVADFS